MICIKTQIVVGHELTPCELPSHRGVVVTTPHDELRPLSETVTIGGHTLIGWEPEIHQYAVEESPTRLI
jgi:hypothetical protein